MANYNARKPLCRDLSSIMAALEITAVVVAVSPARRCGRCIPEPSRGPGDMAAARVPFTHHVMNGNVTGDVWKVTQVGREARWASGVSPSASQPQFPAEIPESSSGWRGASEQPLQALVDPRSGHWSHSFGMNSGVLCVTCCSLGCCCQAQHCPQRRRDVNR